MKAQLAARKQEKEDRRKRAAYKKQLARNRKQYQKMSPEEKKEYAKKQNARQQTPEWKEREKQLREERAVRRADAKRRIKQKEIYYEKKKEAHEAHAELARRELARKKIIHFIQRFDSEYQAGWVHHDICRRLEQFYEDVAAKKSPRLMLFVPPRHGKSYIASDYYPSWCLGKNPRLKFIAASYAVSLPIEFSRNIRDRIKSPEYKAVFRHTAISQASKAAEAWKTTQNGSFLAAGVGGGITGKGADIFVIDDPIKDAEEADSEVVRDKVWDWYGSTAYTRMSPGGGMLIIQTRWHDDDLSGRLIIQMRDHLRNETPDGKFDEWEIIEYPAEATHDEWMNPDRSISATPTDNESIKLRSKGDALHEERFSHDLLMRIKSTLQPRHWSALYQQNPVPEEGIYFTKDMFRFEPPVLPSQYHYMHRFIAGDLAIGEKETNDYTVFVVGALDYDDRIHILDMVRFRGNAFKIVENLLDLVAVYDPMLVGIEKGQLELAILPQLRKRMRERRLYPTLAEGKQALKPIQDKWKRARPLQGRMQQGMVFFPNNQPWVETAMSELMRFPGGVHDDIVDAMAWVARMIIDQEPPTKPKEKRYASWKDKIHKYVKSGDDVNSHMAS